MEDEFCNLHSLGIHSIHISRYAPLEVWERMHFNGLYVTCLDGTAVGKRDENNLHGFLGFKR